MPASSTNACPGPIVATIQPAERGADEEERERPDELIERVRLQQQVTRDDLRHDRHERRPEERLARAEHGSEGDQVPELDRARSARARRSSPPRPRAARSAAIMIRRRSKRSETTPPTRTKRPTGSVQATPTSDSAVGESESCVDLPRERDHVDAVAGERHRRPGPEQGEVPDPERTQDADPRQAAGIGLGRRAEFHDRSVGRLPQRAGEAAARTTCLRQGPRVGLQLEVVELALELAVALQPLLETGSRRRARPARRSRARSRARSRRSGRRRRGPPRR